MLDIRLLREDVDEVKRRVTTRGEGYAHLLDKAIEVDHKRRKAETEIQSLQQERNARSKEIGEAKRSGEDTSEIEAEVRETGLRISEASSRLEELHAGQSALLLGIPNLPHEDCPVGEDEAANPTIRSWGEKPSFGFRPEGSPDSRDKRWEFLISNRGRIISGSGFLCFPWGRGEA